MAKFVTGDYNLADDGLYTEIGRKSCGSCPEDWIWLGAACGADGLTARVARQDLASWRATLRGHKWHKSRGPKITESNTFGSAQDVRWRRLLRTAALSSTPESCRPAHFVGEVPHSDVIPDEVGTPKAQAATHRVP